jgi:hypothetical protein
MKVPAVTVVACTLLKLTSPLVPETFPATVVTVAPAGESESKARVKVNSSVFFI